VRKIALWEAKHPKTVLIAALLLLIPAIIGFVCTKVNYDILSYLPDELESVQGEQVLDETFNTAGISIVITENMQSKQTLALKNEILNVSGVSSVIWVDTIADIGIPADILPDVLKNVFYSADGSQTMMLVRYDNTGSDDSQLKAIAEIKTLLGKNQFLSGLSVIVDDTREIAETQAPLYIAVAVALALVVMSVLMESWFQPLIILFSLGLAVIYNMGTNFFLGSISFITQCVAAVLQLGVTMDYSIFLIDRYAEEKQHFATREEAMAEAVAVSMTALMGSSLTTVFGFLALCFMKLGLGFDIGFVMAKGVVLGILTVIFALPAVVLLFEKQIIKYRHRSFVPNFSRLNKFTLRHKKAFALLFLLLLAPMYFIQKNIELYYSMDKALPSYLTSMQGLEKLKDDFGMACTQFVIIDDGLPAEKLTEMEQKLEDMDGVSSLLAYNSIIGTAIPDDIIPDELLSLCKQGGKQLMMINSEYGAATDEMTAQLEQMDEIVKSYDPDAYITGEGAITQGLIDTTDVDFAVTSILSIAAIFILIAICFKSPSIPVILVLSIELAIWINLSITVISGTEASFVDPTVVNCVQLGATVDYAILLTTRFREELQNLPRDEAMLKAVGAAQQSIFQSAGVFFAATFGVYLVCDIYIVRGMCALLARGAIISEIVIIFLLSPVLCVCESIIAKTTPSWRLKT
jgi:uncharacterized protein